MHETFQSYSPDRYRKPRQSAHAYGESASNTHYRLLSDTRSLHNNASNVQAKLGQRLQQVADWEAADIQMMIDAWRAGGNPIGLWVSVGVLALGRSAASH